MIILLPVDGSELSLYETRFALRLVREGLAASFVLANVQEPASFYEIVTARNDPALLAGVARGAGEDMIAPAARLLEDAGVAFATAVVTGEPVQAMLELIEVHRCDLVVIGSRAPGPLRAALEGSTAARLVHVAPVPVLLVKPPTD